MTKRYITLILLSIFIIGTCLGQTVKISISPQNKAKNNIAVGELFYLTVTYSGNINEAPSTPNLPGASLLYPFEMPVYFNEFSSVNGVTKQDHGVKFTATYKAKAEGSYSFGPFVINGKKSNTVNYSIVSPSSNASQQGNQFNFDSSTDNSKPKSIGNGNSDLFMRASVSETTAFEQQALVYTVKLYCSYDGVTFIGATASPKFDGFVVEESKDVSKSWSLESYQGKNYKTAVIARYIIFPQMTGNLKITGNTYTISVEDREYFLDRAWGILSYGKPVQLNVTPNDLTVNIKPLPQDKPKDFSGGVGKFTITAQIKNKSLKTNEVGSIIYKVQGTGNLKYIQLPDLSLIYPPEIDVFSNNSTVDVNVGANNVSGSVTYDYSIMPLEEGKFHIPEVKLVYFNPETGTYETAVAQGFDIEVGKGSAASPVTSRLRMDSRLQDINPKELSKEIKPNILKFVYWLWFIIPSFIFVIFFIIYSRYKSLHKDLVSLNSKRADKIARKRLRKAAKAMRKNNAELFYSELLTALWGYLGDKLKMPTSELMRDNVRQVMSSKEISDDLIDMFIRIIDDAEFAKYSSAGGKENLQKVYDEAADTINTLEKAFKK